MRRTLALFLFFLCAGSASGQVWQRFGTVMTPLSTDTNTVLFGGTSNQAVLYDTNPQLISANPDGKVMKMWFMGKNDLFYAESNDGIHFTRRSSALLTTTGQPGIWKDGSTYYLYGTTGEPTQTNNGITVWTSSDGITWSSQGVGLAVGGVGQFDHAGLWYLRVWFKSGSTWSASYSASGGIGIATSTDLIHWTNGSSALSLTPSMGGVYPLFVGGTYYLYGACNLSGSNNQLCKISSSDTVTWSGSNTTILPEVQANEGKNIATVTTTSEGQGVPSVVTGPNGQTFIYYSGTAVGNGSAYTVMGAVSAVPLATLVTGSEGAIVPVFPIGAVLQSDNFTRANETPLSDGGKWAIAASSNVQINLVSNKAVATSTSFSSRMVWNGDSWPSNQYSIITIAAFSPTSTVCARTQSNSSTTTAYQACANGNGSWFIQGSLAGGTTAINFAVASPGSASFALNDTITLVAANSVLAFYHNSTLVQTVYDSMFTGGSPGIGLFDSGTAANAKSSLFQGGNIAGTSQVGGFLVQ